MNLNEFQTLRVDRRTLLADLVTPVGLYLAARDLFPGSCLFESSDSRGAAQSRSYICVDPLVTIVATSKSLRVTRSGSAPEDFPLESPAGAWALFNRISDSIRIDGERGEAGFFGFLGYDAVECFEDISIRARKNDALGLPAFSLSLFRCVLELDHFRNVITVTELISDSESSGVRAAFREKIDSALARQEQWSFPFSRVGAETSSVTDDEFRSMVERCLIHIRRGDVFQIVPSRRFRQQFRGDDFQVYRHLRSINPSPYLFYLDLLDYRLFGSSPELHISVRDGTATISPIAGTVRRTASEADDLGLAEALKADPKENAEHVMLVDLARNDLSRHCDEVRVEAFGEIHFYSHVIHLVSRVTGRMPDVPGAGLKLIADTFPAGTLSGAPKYRAMQIIDQLETDRRGFYGGAVGRIGLDGTVNLAIVIRSFLSRDRALTFQAGAGIVHGSVPDKELAEVNAKLSALRAALKAAEEASV